jgi:hypothetical protein
MSDIGQLDRNKDRFLEYNKYFEQIARDSKIINHTDEHRHFVRYELNEVFSAKHDQLESPFIGLETPDIKIKNEDGQNVQAVWKGAIIIGHGYEKGNFSDRDKALDKCYQLFLKIIGKIHHDRVPKVRNGKLHHRIIQFDIDSLQANRIFDFFGGHRAGLRFEFELNSQFDLGYYESDWRNVDDPTPQPPLATVIDQGNEIELFQGDDYTCKVIPAPDGSLVLKNTAGDTLATYAVPSDQEVIQTAPNATVTNQAEDYSLSIASGATEKLPFGKVKNKEGNDVQVDYKPADDGYMFEETACTASASVRVVAYQEETYATVILNAVVGTEIFLRAEDVEGVTPVKYRFEFECADGIPQLIYEGAANNTSWTVAGANGAGRLFIHVTDDPSNPASWVGHSVAFEAVVNTDTDALAWLAFNSFANDTTVLNTTYGITGQNLHSDLHTFYEALKAESGLYEAIHWMYLYFGGDADKAKINLINPQDNDAAFRVTWNGGWIFNDEGRISNGTNTFGNTHFDASNELSANDGAYFIYTRDPTVGGTTSVMWGASEPSAKNNTLVLLATGDISSYSIAGNNKVLSGAPVVNPTGFNCITKDTASGNTKWYTNDGSLFNTNTNSQNGHPNLNEFIGAFNNNGTPANYVKNGVRVGIEGRLDGLTQPQVVALRNAVVNLMTALGWNV